MKTLIEIIENKGNGIFITKDIVEKYGNTEFVDKYDICEFFNDDYQSDSTHTNTLIYETNEIFDRRIKTENNDIYICKDIYKYEEVLVILHKNGSVLLIDNISGVEL